MVVTCSIGKDFEIQSWNEQGEITKIEGILTVAFSFISFCSHRDRKELYLIIKIHYMVNMPDSLKVVKEYDIYDMIYRELNENNPKLEQYIKKLESEIYELKSEKNNLLEHIGKIAKKIDKILEQYKTEKKENEKLKNENIGLRELLVKNSSGWEIIGDNVAVGVNPFTKKIEQYGFPKNFDEKKANDQHFTDDNFYMCNFKYFYQDDWPWPNGPRKLYDMPIRFCII